MIKISLKANYKNIFIKKFDIMQTIQIKRGLSTAVLATALKAGEFAFARDTGKLYIGTNGTTAGNVIINPDGGTADEAVKLAVARAFSISGDATAPAVDFDGTAAVNLVLELAASGVTAGTYGKVTVDAKGRVTEGADLALEDLKFDIPASKITGLGTASAKDVEYFDVAGAATEAAANLKKEVVNAVKAGDTSVTVGGSVTEPTVAVKVDPAVGNALTLGAAGLSVTIPAASTYTIVKAEDSGDFAAVYNLQKDGANVGASINIPKDMVVSGKVVVNPEGQTPGTYIELTIANKTSDKIYINVADLIEYVTSGSQETDMVVIAISEDHKVTATITDGSITLEKLAAGVKASLGLADSALQNSDIATGATNGTIAVEGTDVAVKGLDTAAYQPKSAFDEAGAAAAVLGTSADTSDKATVYGVKKYAQEEIAKVQTAADGKVASVTAADKSITVAGEATAPTVKVAISAASGNALSLGTDGLFVATEKAYTAGDGIAISDERVVSTKVVAGNGLSLNSANGITMDVASTAVAGAVKPDGTSITVAAGVISVGDIDAGEIV